MPLQEESLFCIVATSDQQLSPQSLRSLFSLPVKLVYVPHEELQFEWKHYPLKSLLFKLAKESLIDYQTKQEGNFIEKFLDNILSFSIHCNASDIHFEIVDKSFIIRLRIDGILKQYFRFSLVVFNPLSSLIKYLGNLDIAQKRLPLNSRFSRQVDTKNYDIRISTLPTVDGESIVLRILDNANVQKSLQEIGFDKKTLHTVSQNITLKQGLILVTGPTGSGKTTTLYSMIQEIRSSEKKIITVEDPVEYKIDGIIQVNINEEIDLDYHKVLKNTLRQDPDILMIGEIRDSISLKIAIQAALTGHLVIATLHTNSAVETITRLFDLEAEPYLIAATLQMVLSQRLVRILCPICKEKQGKYYEPKGCKECNFTGFDGRQVVAEVVDIDKELSRLILTQKNTRDLETTLFSRGFCTMAHNGLFLAEQGITTPSECHAKI